MKTIGIISLSNEINPKNKHIIEEITKKLNANNINVKSSKAIYTENGSSLNPKYKASELMKLYQDENINAIFDISGGDLANLVLPFIDFEIIKKHNKPFFGYSDLSVILNAIYKKSNTFGYWYQLRSIVNDENSLNLLIKYLLNDDKSIFNFKYKFLQGNKMEGTVIGGNLRCSLKLAGTEFMPSFKDKLLLIESMGGDINKIKTYITHYKLIGAFEKVNGVILGTFTELEKNMDLNNVENLILNLIDNKELPIIKTQEIGHSSTSKCIIIGKNYNFS